MVEADLVMVLLGFYILYAFQNVFDSVFYGLGKTNYMLFESVVTNTVYYGVAFILYLTGVWTPSLIGIALLFGIGNAFDSVVSLVAFLFLLKKRIREIKPDAFLLGEVWEDASNKEAYGVRRRYFVDGTLDSCMNYPFRTAILNFMRGLDDGSGLKETVLTIAENYPAQVFACNMNLLGTHDTARILTTLVDDFDGSRAEKASRHLSSSELTLARQRFLMASFLQYMLPGAPSLYYGDEAGMEGYKDPFNRRTYPWGKEDAILLSHFRQLGNLRKACDALRLGDIRFFHANEQKLGFSRSLNGKQVRIYMNRSDDSWEIPAGNLLYGHNLRTVAPTWLTLSPMGFCITEAL